MYVNEKIDHVDDRECHWDEDIDEWASNEEDIDQTDPEDYVEEC